MTYQADNLNKFGYIIIRNLVEKSEVERLYEYTLKNMMNWNFADGQVPGSPSFYQDKEMTILHKTLTPKIEEITALKLIPTFAFNRVYRTGAILRAHKDRRACELAITLNLGQKGEMWDIWLLDYNENAQKISLAPGDAIIYRGSRLTHWRGKLDNADYVSQVLFFFVEKKGNDLIALWAEFITRALAYAEECIKKLFKSVKRS